MVSVYPLVRITSNPSRISVVKHLKINDMAQLKGHIYAFLNKSCNNEIFNIINSGEMSSIHTLFLCLLLILLKCLDHLQQDI